MRITLHGKQRQSTAMLLFTLNMGVCVRQQKNREKITQPTITQRWVKSCRKIAQGRHTWATSVKDFIGAVGSNHPERMSQQVQFRSQMFTEKEKSLCASGLSIPWVLYINSC